MSVEQKQVTTVHGASSNQELIDRYATWATEYESDMIQGLGYTMPQDASNILTKYVPTSARILDAGAGTGLVGVELAKLGYTNIACMDLSEEMIQEAKSKQVYADFYQMILGEPLDFETNAFDAVISIGTFTAGHAPASAFADLVRITKPGGYIVYSLPDYLGREGEFPEQHEALSKGSQWKLIEETEPFVGLPKGDKTLMYQYWVYQVLADA